MIPTSKFGDCDRCPTKNTQVRKRKKELVCIPCCKIEDNEKQIANQKAKAKIQRTLSSLKNNDSNREQVAKEKSKSELLLLADKVFGDFIKKRDSDKDGFVTCPCCDKRFHIDDKNDNGEKIAQCLHFVTRKDYFQRFDETNARCGHSWCNLQMHIHPTGKEYQNYKNKMIRDFGANEVRRMELSPRNINRLETQQLKNVIEHYKI